MSRLRGRAAALAVTALLTTGCASATASPPSSSAAADASQPVWAQEFDGAEGAAPDASAWLSMDLAGGWGNDELQAYTPDNARLDGAGNLVITAREEDHVDPEGNRASYTSARLESVSAFHLGRIEARILVPSGQGLWSAFWLLGLDHWSTGWPQVGEIDVMELLGDARTLHGSVHGAEVDGGHWRSQGTRAGGFAGAWHEYAIEWTDDEIRFLVDGEEYHRIGREDLEPDQVWPFDRPQHVILNLAVGGDWPGSPDGTTVLPAELKVDWVRVYGSTIHSR